MRRLLLLPAILSVLVAFVPTGSIAGSCWPIPESSPACRPVPWPSGIPGPQMPNGYDGQLVIAGGMYLPPSSDPDQPKIDVRWGGNIFVHNLDGEGHTVTIVAPSCQFPFTGCAVVKQIGVQGLAAGPLAGRLTFDTSLFSMKTIYPFFCAVHKDGTGNPLHYGYFHVRW